MSNQLLIRRIELEAMAKWETVDGLSPMTIQAKKLKSIGAYGRCEQEDIPVWNQLIYNANFSVGGDTPTGWGTSYGTTFDNTDPDFVVVNGGNYIYQMPQQNGLTTGHIYYISVTAKYTGPNTTGYVYLPEFDTTLYYPETDMSWTDIELIKTARNAGTTAGYGIFRIMNSNSGIAIDKNHGVQMFDLTAIFGAGNEPTTVQDFKDSYEEIFGHPLTYEPYNPGTVLETKDIICNNGALKVSPNIFNIDGTNTSNGYVSGKYLYTDGSLQSFGTARVSEYIIVSPETDYYYSGIPTNYVGGCCICWYDSSKGFLSSVSANKGVKTSPQSAAYCRLSYRTDAGSPYMFTKGNDLVTYMAYRQVYTDGTQETLKVRHNGITPSSFSDYVATSEKTGPYSYSFSWSPTSSNTWNGISAGNITIIEGHKYYYCANMSSSTSANLYLSFSSGLTTASKGKSNVVANTDYLISAISEATVSSNSIIMYIRAGYADAGGDYTGYANNIGLFDLTAIYGAGNEPTTDSEARQQLCLDSNFSTENLLSCGTYKDFQNLTTGEISRNVGVKVLTGTETFALDNWRPYSGTYAFALYKNELPGILEASTNNVKSTHFQSATYSGGGGLYYGGTGICIYSNNGNYSVFIRVPNSIATDMATMKSWLAQQYTNGTPVIIVYPLNDTQLDSTSGHTLPMIRKGLNTIEVTQASVESTHDLSVQATYKEINDTHDYLSFTATAASSSITLNKVGSPNSISLEYSLNKKTWIPYTVGETIQIANSETVYLRKTANTIATQISSSSSNYYQFAMTGSINGDGNIMSLLDKSCVSTTVGNYCFYRLFRDCTALKTSPKIPATSLGTYCYCYMFYNAGLTTAPVLPATTMTNYCYNSMFYNNKFTVAPQLPATELATRCYAYMFTNCTLMTVAPELPATVLKDNCYNQMFYQCFGLTSFPRLEFTTMATGCFTYMFQACRNITSYHLSSLNASGNTFYGNSGCTSLTIDAVEPPTIGANTIIGLKADCIIYVPAESVEAYKAKQYWSDRATYIQAIPE